MSHIAHAHAMALSSIAYSRSIASAIHNALMQGTVTMSYLHVLAVFFAFVSMLFVFALMYGGQHRQHDLNDLHMQTASGRIPPSWSPERDRNYSFRQFTQDLVLWSTATDVPVERQGPCVALRLAGSAKILAREMDSDMLVNGVIIPDPVGGMMRDAQGNLVPAVIQITGLQALLRQLQRRYAPLDQEIQITAISELFHFRRHGSENTDELIARFDLVIHRAANQGQVVIGEPIMSWMLLSASGMGRDKWAMFLQPTAGALPSTPAEYAAFQQYMRRQGHLFDRGGSETKTLQQPFFSNYSAEQGYSGYPVFEPPQQGGDMWSYHEVGWHDAPVYYGDECDDMSYDDADAYSSGQSDADEAVDLSEVQGMPISAAGELLYFGYRSAKRKFRAFTRQPGRSKGRGKGRGKKGRSKGSKGKHAFMQYSDDYEQQQYDQYAYDGDGYDQVYKGSKSKGSGKGRRRNPVGPDGKVMTCSGCESEEHFIRNCPKGPGKGKGSSSSGKSKGSAFVAEEVHWSQQAGVLPGVGGARAYHSRPVLCDEVTSSALFFADGSVEHLGQVACSPNSSPSAAAAAAASPSSSSSIRDSITTIPKKGPPKPVPSHMQNWLQFPCWLADAVYHASVRLANGREGMLVDVGAIHNLCGDAWAQRVEARAAQAGQGTTWTECETVKLEGVGTGTNDADRHVQLPICTADGVHGRFDAIVVRNSELPALLGLQSIERNHGVIDTFNCRMIYPGPGGIQFNLSPGTKVFKLEKAATGHLLVPCCEWQTSANSNKVSKHVHFDTVGNQDISVFH